MINRQFRLEWQDTRRVSQTSTRPKRGLLLWANHIARGPEFIVRRAASSASLLIVLVLFSACMSSTRQQRPSYREPNTVSASSIFGKGQLSPDIEFQHLASARTAPALLRRSWLELQLGMPQAALDTSAQVIYAEHKPSVNEESFARYLRAEAFRVQGHSERGDFDRKRAQQLALDPELQRRLLPAALPPPSSGPSWGRLAVERRSAWRPLPPNRSNLDPMQRPRRVTIHHSAVYIRDKRPSAAAAQIGRIQREHMRNRGYGDIGYHFLIDPSGRVWEGRQLRYQGAHASGSNNIGNIGICLLGNFMRQPKDGQGPTRAQVRSMEQLVMQMMRHYRFGGDALFCHSDFKNTACPGPRMQPIVKQLARQLQARLAGHSLPAGRNNARRRPTTEEDE